ncbi:GNAT family N-acetyltransferase [Jatrophihabitans sp.]|uniref:GNAT family N-acetyltransferase n=1 Tax=Jatrophihabitans sp. TaxID=1932789 RepID=UPI002BDFAF44|nr:GNAT family N-acetyltransferase [Jatrophihabitans sp.]
MAEIVFSSDLDDVDWAALKDALVADDFDNLRTPDQYRRSHENSHAVVFGRCEGRFVANGRILSDGVCNAYLVDIWTATPHRRQGVGREVVNRLLATVPGQHVALFTDDMPAFYRTLGFAPQVGGMSRIVGEWLAGG